MDPELAVSLELLLIEELIQCRLVWELRVIDPVSLDELGFIAGHRELQVEQQSGALAIMNPAEVKMTLARAGRRVRAQVVEPRISADAKVDLRVANERHQPVESECRVGLAIDADNEFGPPPEQFIDGEVFDVAAVGEVQSTLPLPTCRCRSFRAAGR